MEIERYNRILGKQKKKKNERNPILIKRKLKMIIGKDQASVGYPRRRYGHNRKGHSVRVQRKGVKNLGLRAGGSNRGGVIR